MSAASAVGGWTDAARGILGGILRARGPGALHEAAAAPWRACSAGEIDVGEAERLHMIAARRIGLGRQAAEPPRRKPAVARSPDREASLRRRRRLGGPLSSRLPLGLAEVLTEGGRALMATIASVIQACGRCELTVGELAARSGIGRTTAQVAMRVARDAGYISVEPRPNPGRKSDTNVVRITCKQWIARLKTTFARVAGSGTAIFAAVGAGISGATMKESKKEGRPRVRRGAESADERVAEPGGSGDDGARA